MSKASSIAKEVQFLSQRYSANWEEFSMVKLDNKWGIIKANETWVLPRPRDYSQICLGYTIQSSKG